MTELRRRVSKALATVVTAVVMMPMLWAGCGGGTRVSGAAGRGGTGATAGSSGSGGVIGFTCPASPPGNATPCTAPPPPDAGYFSSSVADCSWGDDPRPRCRTTARCSASTWEVMAPDATACSSPPLAAACPTTPPADTTVCADSTVSCWYSSGTRCWCSGCQGGSGYPVCQILDPPQWYCATPAAGCPIVMPQAGTPCDTSGLSCGPDCDLQISCQGGLWRWLQGSCPRCAAPNTPIATPFGERPISSLRVGDLVYSVDAGAIVAVPIARVASTRVGTHRVMRVVLSTGAVLEISPGHPTADGRTFGDLSAGCALDEQHQVLSSEFVLYRYDATYDVLPTSSTGTYFAAGALIGSTLAAPAFAHHQRATVCE